MSTLEIPYVSPAIRFAKNPMMALSALRGGNKSWASQLVSKIPRLIQNPIKTLSTLEIPYVSKFIKNPMMALSALRGGKKRKRGGLTS